MSRKLEKTDSRLIVACFFHLIYPILVNINKRLRRKSLKICSNAHWLLILLDFLDFDCKTFFFPYKIFHKVILSDTRKFLCLVP